MHFIHLREATVNELGFILVGILLSKRQIYLIHSIHKKSSKEPRPGFSMCETILLAERVHL